MNDQQIMDKNHVAIASMLMDKEYKIRNKPRLITQMQEERKFEKFHRKSLNGGKVETRPQGNDAN